MAPWIVPATFSITVTAVNDAPVVLDDANATDEDTAITSDALTNVLANDTDADLDTLTVTEVNGSMAAVGNPLTLPSGAVVTVNADGSYTYDPSGAFNNLAAGELDADSFTYTVSDGNGGTATATVDIVIVGLNDAPTAGDDTATTAEDTPLTISDSTLLSNDNDPDTSDTLTITSVGNAVNGTVVQNGDGTITFTPDANFHGAASFDYTIDDGNGGTDTATVNITVTSVNDPPIAVDDTATVAEDSVNNTLFVLSNDSDPDGDPIMVSNVGAPMHGTVTILSPGATVLYTPDPDYFGPDSFTYSISDGNGGTATATVNITVTNVNDAPVAVDDTATTAEDTPLTLTQADLKGNDTDVDGDTLTVTAVSNPTNGTVVLNMDGTVTFTPAANFTGTAGFDYTVSDGNSGTDTGHVTVTVTPVNDAPVAVDDTATTVEDTPVTLTQGDLVGNDTDVDGGTLTVTAVSNPTNGTVVLNMDGTVTFTPAADFTGTAGFDYTVSDGTLTDTGHVTVTVTPVNDAPVAVDDTATTPEDTALVLTSAQLTANDTDVDGDALTVTAVGNAVHGTVSLSGGTITFTPDANYNGPASFEYTVSDGTLTDTATVNITVTPVNDAPDAVDDNATVVEDSTNNVIVVLTNDTDIDGDTLTVSNVGNAAHGNVSLSGSGQITYTPNANYTGPDSFTYTISDGHGGMDTATVHLTVTPVNDAPVALNQSVTTAEDTPKNGTLVATDVDGDTLTYMLVAGPAHGAVVVNGDGTFTYTPAANYNGSDSFTFKANDGTLDSNVATVSITVTAVNDAPVAQNQSITTVEDTATNGTLVATDVDGDSLTYSLVAGAAHGTAVVNPDGTFTYTPAANYFGPDSFTFKASDGALDSNVATVSISVTPVNDPPDAVDDVAIVAEDSSNNLIPVRDNDTDPDGDALTITAVGIPSHGTAIIGPMGGVRYTPNPDYVGPDSFTYTITDGNGGFDTATINITVTNVNDAPVAVDDGPFTTAEDTPIMLTGAQLTANDTDVDGNPLSVSAVSNPTNGTVSLSGGVVTFTPAADFTGTAGFDYTVTDGMLTDVGHVTITVTAVNDAPVATDDSFTTNEDTALNLTQTQLTGNDVDVDGDALTVTAVSNPVNGTVILNMDGTITFTPAANFFGTAGFDYTVSDGTLSDTGHVTVTVTSVNDAPVAVDDTATTAEDTPLSLNSSSLTSNDTDVEGDTLTVTAVSNPTNGTVTLSGTTITFTPDANFNGTAGFDYTVSDGNGGTDVGHVTVTVTPVPDNPIAVDDNVTVNEDSTNNVINVLANDSDPDGDTLTVIMVGTPTHGDVTIGPGGVAYTPDPNYVGPDSFTYTIDDGTGRTATATVHITVANVNDNPVANDDTATVNEDTANNVINVLANDTDPEGDMLTVTAVTQPANGTVSIGIGGANVLYTPNPDFAGTDTFTYTVDDGNGGTDTATVTVTVTNVNEEPDADDDTATVNEDSTNNIIDVLANDTDVDGGTLTVTAVTQGANGTVAVGTGGANVLYTPNAGFVGTDTFTYTISDGQGGSDTATVTVTVANVNDNPVANDDTATVNEDSTANVINVLSNDTDVDGDTLTVSAVTQGAHGTVSIGTGGANITYTPNANFAGTDTFTYTVSDGNGGTDTATVTVTVLNIDTDFQGTNGDDVFLVRRDAAGTNIEVFDNDTGTGTPIFSMPYGSVPI